MQVITVSKREEQGTRDIKALAKDDLVPGIMYGEGLPSRSISIKRSLLRKAMDQQTGTGLLDVQVAGDDAPVKVIVHDWQRDPISDRVIHVDFYQVRMDKKLHTEIPINFIGVALAVKDLGGTLVRQITELPVECLPGDLVHHIDVSIDALKTFEDAIHVRDLSLPAGIATRLNPDDIVAAVAAPRSEEELANLNTEVAADVAKVEVTTEKKDDAAEGGDSAGADKKSE